jgi:outer membrane lipoprotein-sorting protein
MVLVLALLAMAPPAPTAQAGWSVQELMQQLARSRPSEARFVERRYLKVLEAPIELSGRLLYVAPDRLEKRTLQPSVHTMIVDGDELTIHEAGRRKPRKLRLQDHPSLWGFIESIRATLAGDLPALERFYTVGLDGTPGDWELALAPRVEAMRSVVELIRIGGADGRVRWIEVNEAHGDRSVTQIFEDSR